MRCRFYHFFAASALIFIVGCGAGKTLKKKPPEMKLKPSPQEMKLKTSFVDFSEEEPTVNVPEKIRKTFQEKLNHLLYNEGAFQEGSDLKIKYRFVWYDPGNQFSRWFWGGLRNTGKGSLMVEAKYFDAAGEELAIIKVEGKIQSGFLGGPFDYALEKAAKKIVEYTKQNFQ